MDRANDIAEMAAKYTREPHTLPLTHGGELTITEHDGDYRLHVHAENGQFSIALSALDVWGLRVLTSTIVADRAAEFASTLDEVAP